MVFHEEVFTSAGLLVGDKPRWQSWGSIGNGNREDAIKQCQDHYSYSENKCPRRVVEGNTVIYKIG